MPADSGEFQLIAARWGIGHPPGYPLYTMAAALWVHLIPAGSAPFRASLFSAFLAATTLALCAQAVSLWARSMGSSERRALLGGAVAALALGSAATFWAQATTTNIRMPTMLFVAWGYVALARYRAAEGNRARQDRALLLLALGAGLGVGHHPSLAFVGVGWALYLLLLDPRLATQPARWLKPAAVAVAAWAIPQLYLPLRGAMAGVPLNPGDLTTWQGFWEHVLARGFGGDMLAYANPPGSRPAAAAAPLALPDAVPHSRAHRDGARLGVALPARLPPGRLTPRLVGGHDLHHDHLSRPPDRGVPDAGLCADGAGAGAGGRSAGEPSSSEPSRASGPRLQCRGLSPPSEARVPGT